MSYCNCNYGSKLSFCYLFSLCFHITRVWVENNPIQETSLDFTQNKKQAAPRDGSKATAWSAALKTHHMKGGSSVPPPSLEMRPKAASTPTAWRGGPRVAPRVAYPWSSPQDCTLWSCLDLKDPHLDSPETPRGLINPCSETHLTLKVVLDLDIKEHYTLIHDSRWLLIFLWVIAVRLIIMVHQHL